MSGYLDRVDHLVYATPQLEQTIDDLEHRLGVRATPGGQHPGRGTRNALIAFSETCYLEIVGPDPRQPAPRGPRWFAIDTLTAPRLVTWAAKAPDLDSRVQRAASAGVQLGPIGEGRRARPEGGMLAWTFTDPAVVVGDGLVPFLIDWGSSAHPAASASRGPSIVGLRAEHRAPVEVQSALKALDLELPVRVGPAPRLIATLLTDRGTVELS